MDTLRALITHINGVLARGASWPGWPLTILAMTTFAAPFHLTDMLLVVLSVQASVASAVMDIRQRHAADEEALRHTADEKRDKMLGESVENTAALVVEVRNQNDLIIDLMRAAERRDKMAAKLNKTMLVALEARNDLLEFLRREVQTRDNKAAEQARRVASGKRKTHGRATRL